MWIRSQDKTGLVNATQIEVIGCEIRDLGHDILLGSYKSKANAIKVLDIIQAFMINYEYFNGGNDGGAENSFTYFIYEMPQSEVKTDGVN